MNKYVHIPTVYSLITFLFDLQKVFLVYVLISVPDPNPDPPDPRVFWASRIRIPIVRCMDPDPDPALDPDPDPSIIKQIYKKNIYFYCFLTSF